MNEKRNRLLKVFNIICKILLSLIIVVFVLYATVSLFEPKKVISTFGVQHFVIQTDSMEPNLNIGDMIFVKKANYEELKPGSIITFYGRVAGKDEIVTHFIDSITIDENNDRVYRTIGLNPANLDAKKLSDDDIIGEYSYKIPKIGKVILFIQHPIGRYVFIADIVIIYLLIKITSKKDKSEKQTQQD